MAKEAQLIVPPGASIGTVKLEADLQTGLCLVIISRPFDLEPIQVNVPLVDVLEAAAGITVSMCQLQRQARRARS